MKKWKDVTPTWQRILKAIFFIVVVAVIIFFVSGCNVEKRAIRQQDKAYGITVSTPRTFTDAINLWFSIHKQDTSVKVIITEPKVIEVKVPQLMKDTTGRQHLIDSVRKANEKEIDCGRAASDAYDLGWDECEKEYLANPVKAKCPPDTTRILQLNSEIRRWQDSSTQKSKELAAKDGIIQELRSSASENKSEISSLKWKLVGAIFGGILLLIISHVGRSYISKLSIPSFLKK